MFRSSKIMNYVSAVFMLFCGVTTARYSALLLPFMQELMQTETDLSADAITPLIPDALVTQGASLFSAMFITMLLGILMLIINIRYKGKGRVLGMVAASMTITAPLFMFFPVVGTGYIVIVMFLYVLTGFFQEKNKNR